MIKSKLKDLDFYLNDLLFLQQNYENIKNDCLKVKYKKLKLKSHVKQYENNFEYGFESWKIYPIMYKGKLLKKIPFTHKPKNTIEIIKRIGIEKICNATFSKFEPTIMSKVHVDKTPYTYRSHLGLIVPKDSGFELDGEDYKVEESHINLFSTENYHKAWNNSNSDRYILIMDFFRPGYDRSVFQ